MQVFDLIEHQPERGVAGRPGSVSALQTGLACLRVQLYGEGQAPRHETCLLFHLAVHSASHSSLLLRHMSTMCRATHRQIMDQVLNVPHSFQPHYFCMLKCRHMVEYSSKDAIKNILNEKQCVNFLVT